MSITTGPSLSSVAPPSPQRSRLLRALWRDGIVRIALLVIVLYILVALFAPLLVALAGVDPYSYHTDALTPAGIPAGFGGISAQHWFGVEPMTGRDLFAIVVLGAQTSLAVGLSAALIAVLIGTIVGTVAAYRGGWTDRFLGKGVEVILGFPFLIFAIALSAILPAEAPRPLILVLVIGFFGWPSIARVIRAETRGLLRQDFVTAPVALGASGWHILRAELLPNLAPTLVVFGTIAIPANIAAEAALSFLGVGVTPPTPSWGRTIGQAVSWVQTSPMYLLIPCLALIGITLSLNILGDALADALNPRLTLRGEA